MVIKKDTLDQLLAGRDPQDVFAKDGLVYELKKALANRVQEHTDVAIAAAFVLRERLRALDGAAPQFIEPATGSADGFE